ncbi:MAG: methyltransferase [Proteobacteria bacterium]|nr:methyltransferase [Pseudomonadota bacterium]
MSGTMTSRERVYAALRHEEPDRVPIDLGSNFNTSVNVIAYNRLKRYLGIESPTYVRYIVPMLAATDLDDNLEILKRMGGDVLDLPPLFLGNWKDGLPHGVMGNPVEFTLKDGSTCLIPESTAPVKKDNGDYELHVVGVPTYLMPKDGYYFDRIFTPLRHIENLSQLKELLPTWTVQGYYGPLDENYLKNAAECAEKMHEQTDYFILGNLNLSVYHAALEVFGYEKFWMFMAGDPDLVHYWMETTTQANERRLAGYLKAVGPYINGFLIGDDYGTQKGLQISPKMFREFVKPYLARICDLIHQTCPHVIVFKHTCGSITPIIPDLIEAGIDALNPVQTTAKDMEADRLKREFGKDLTFWGGGVSAQTTLFSGDVDAVRREVKEKMEIFAPGGGYVFTTDHDIQEHVQPEVIEAIFQTALENA